MILSIKHDFRVLIRYKRGGHLVFCTSKMEVPAFIKNRVHSPISYPGGIKPLGALAECNVANVSAPFRQMFFCIIFFILAGDTQIDMVILC